MMRAVMLFLLLLLSLIGADVENGCADVTAATAEQNTADGTWTFYVTVSSPDTGWEKYADAWEVRYSSLSGTTVLGTRVLGHPHVMDQPFTRSLAGVVIPETINTVVIAARDSVEGYCGEEFTLQLPRQNGNETLGPPITATPSSAMSATPSPSQAPVDSAALNDGTTSGSLARLPCSIVTWLALLISISGAL